MRQRLALAKTLLHEPQVLLLDEPASGLDPAGRVEMRNILSEVAGKGAAVLISSHILTELSEYCTSMGIMEKGRLIVSGKIDAILTQIGSRGALHVRANAPHPALAELLAKAEFLTQVEVTDNCVARTLVRGDDCDLARLLSGLISAGVEVASFHVEKEDIEDIFLKVGAKEVS
jgi:ABC-2 type transport system ATP-binding protein